MRRYSKRDRIRAKLALLGALARLADRDADIRRCRQAARIEPGENADENCSLALLRFERTRKALARIERGLGIGVAQHGEWAGA